MTDRNFKKELNHYIYNDPEYGEDVENIDYDCLIGIITELCDRIEQLEKVNKENLSLLKLVEKNND
jgi:hypothetical protein